MSTSSFLTRNDLINIIDAIFPATSEDMTDEQIQAFINSVEYNLQNQVDYIVEQGTSGIWTYRKWNSGIAECWGTYSWTVTSWSAWGNLYESNNSYVNYPTGLFSSKPIVQIVPNCDNGAIGAASVEVWTGHTAIRTPNFNFIRGNTGTTNTTGAVNIYARGNWK